MSHDRRILIADDDQEIRLGMAELLSFLGVEILQAETGVQALDLVRSGRLHLALLDHKMPGPTGLEILETIRAELLGVPAILCSADAAGDVGILARRAGAFAVLTKPVKPAALKQEVIRALTFSSDPRMPGSNPRPLDS
ncbi:MAG: response regulator [bacterium]|jgi:CheY-like chemotaxis protein|nr:response regulator [Planctomycetota bacterium]HIL52720.1 response regulator [Planctomycetota bacterium]